MSRVSEPSITVSHLTKDFGRVRAVDDLSFEVLPGRVTGFLGPNGAGKTTTLRCLLGLVRADEGHARVNGADYRSLKNPARTVGAVLEATGFHPGRSALAHMEIRADVLYGRRESQRCRNLLGFVGLGDAQKRRVGGFSMGMRQRLTLAQALLGEPDILILDEPTNGLDPAGIAWLREFLRSLADQGRTILVSSHLLAEVRQSVDDVVIVSRGRLRRAGRLGDLIGSGAAVLVRSPQTEQLRAALEQARADVRGSSPDGLEVRGLSMAEIGHRAHACDAEVHELRELDAETDLERLFLALTEGDGDA